MVPALAFSLPGNYPGYLVTPGKKTDPANNLKELIVETLKLPSRDQKIENFRSMAFLIHEIFPKKMDVTQFIDKIEQLIDQLSQEQSQDVGLFLKSWVLHGYLDEGSLIDLKHMVSRRQNRNSYRDLLALIDIQKSRVVQTASPQAARTTPKIDMLAWLNKSWDATSISEALTELCMPFYQLRSWEFGNEQNSGPNLALLNRRCTSLADFVTTSVLTAATESAKKAKKVAAKWLAIAQSLNERNNFHMMFAIQNGLLANAVDRLTWLFEELPEKSRKTLQKLNELFSLSDKMRELTVRTEGLAGKSPAIPCIYWLYNKSLLSREAPLYLENGSLNIQRFVSASNIFRNMAELQSTPYDNSKPNSEVLSYFMCLDNESCKADEEKLREVSDHVRAKKSGSYRTLKNKPISWEDVFEKK